MLKDRNEQVQFTVKVADVFICVASFFAAYWIRSATASYFHTSDLVPLDGMLWLLAASLTIHFLIYPSCGFYQSLRLKTILEIFTMLCRAIAAEFFILGTLVFLFQAKTTSRYFFGLFLLTNYGMLLVERLGARFMLFSVRRRGYNFRQVLIVGTGSNASRVIEVLQRNKHWGYVPFGLLREAGGDSAVQSLKGVAVIGDVRDLESLVHNRAVDEVYFAPTQLDPAEVDEQVALCETLGIPARFSLSLFDLPHSRVAFNVLDHLPVVTFYTTLRTPAQTVAKRVIDILISMLGLLFTVVVYPWISWRIQRESPGPVIFKQNRVGENGRSFKCYKFRTMSLDAEIQKESLLSKNQMEGPIFKMDSDPRIFPFGAFLRQTSLDELPQFFNIFRGDMSVVGTRPPTPDEVKQYHFHYRRRLSVRPGLTGLWQVSGRNGVKRFEDILELDLNYIDRWSIWLDLRIIARTVWIILFRHGAY